MKNLGIVTLMIFIAIGLFAQPPLSKRDQKKLEEFEAKIEAEKNYYETMRLADSAFKNDNYVDARMLYEKAIQYDSEKEAWLTSKVNDLDILMAKNIARKVDSIQTVNKKGIQRIEVNKSPNEQVATREINLEMTPKIIESEEAPEEPEVPEAASEVADSSEPAQEVKVESKPEVKKPEQEKPKGRIAPAEKTKPETNEEPEEDLFKDFPSGFTEDIFTFPDHEVLRIVVKEGIDTMVYKRVKHRWGGEFYFKDGVSISKRIWLEEVDQYRKRYGSSPAE